MRMRWTLISAESSIGTYIVTVTSLGSSTVIMLLIRNAQLKRELWMLCSLCDECACGVLCHSWHCHLKLVDSYAAYGKFSASSLSNCSLFPPSPCQFALVNESRCFCSVQCGCIPRCTAWSGTVLRNVPVHDGFCLGVKDTTLPRSAFLGVTPNMFAIFSRFQLPCFKFMRKDEW